MANYTHRWGIIHHTELAFMFKVFGYIFMFGSIALGYFEAGGKFGALWQPAEIIIIAGAGIGAFLASHPKPVRKLSMKMLKQIFGKNKYDKKFFMTLFKMLFQIFDTIKKKGAASVEDDMESPKESELFSAFPEILAEERMIAYLTDTFRTISMVTLSVHELDEAMESEMHAIEAELTAPGAAIQEMADGFPGFGIVAAVMGIVVTMQAMGGPVEIIGKKVGAALVGTFMGILLCYGLVGPMATSMKNLAHDRVLVLECIKNAMVAFQAGRPPLIAVDSARRLLNDDLRPTFLELEEWIRGEE